MDNPRDPEGLMPDADVTGGPAPDAEGSGSELMGRTDMDEHGSDPDVRFPGDAEDPTMSSPDASANARHPDDPPGIA